MFDVGTLEQLAEITMGQSPKGSTVSNEIGTPLLNGPTEFGINHPHPVQFTIDPKRLAKKGDLLFCVRGSTGRMNWADQDYAIGRGIASIREKNPETLHFIKGAIQINLERLTDAAIGSVITGIKKEDLFKFECPIPDKKQIVQISKFLKNFYQKIENNQQMNIKLEEIAKAVFKSWFLDFDPVKAKIDKSVTGLSKEISDLFPDSLITTELGEIPKGWEIKKIKDLGKVICGKTPPTKDKENYGEGFKFITIPDMHNQVFVLDSSKNITEKGAATLEGKLLPSKTICVSCIATPGLTVIIDEPSYTNQQINSIIPNETFLSYFLFLNFRLLGSKISIYGGGGSVFENLSKSKFENILVKIPDQKVLKSFDEFLTPVFDKIKVNLKENKLLENILDTLLPKLISGKLKISDAKTIVEKIKI